MFFVGAPPFCGAIFDAHSVPKCSVIWAAKIGWIINFILGIFIKKYHLWNF
jgi:hypothetical protein